LNQKDNPQPEIFTPIPPRGAKEEDFKAPGLGGQKPGDKHLLYTKAQIS